MNVTAPSDAVGKNLACICVKGFTFDQMDHSIFGQELKHSVRKVGEWYALDVNRLQ